MLGKPIERRYGKMELTCIDGRIVNLANQEITRSYLLGSGILPGIEDNITVSIPEYKQQPTRLVSVREYAAIDAAYKSIGYGGCDLPQFREILDIRKPYTTQDGKIKYPWVRFALKSIGLQERAGVKQNYTDGNTLSVGLNTEMIGWRAPSPLLTYDQEISDPTSFEYTEISRRATYLEKSIPAILSELVDQSELTASELTPTHRDFALSLALHGLTSLYTLAHEQAGVAA